MKKPQNAKQAREQMLAEARPKQAPPDPMASLQPKQLAIRIGIPAIVVWAIAFAIPGWIPKAVAGALTLGVAGLLVWAVRFARRSRAVARIVHKADTPEARKEAIEKLEAGFKKDDTAAVFAKAQLQMQEDPRAALRTLETIKLEKVMAPIADEARAQRAMIHLVLGDTGEARDLVDGIDLSRHKEPKTRATLVAVMGEAWARTGQAKKAVELLEAIDPKDEVYKELRPQLLRARAFAYAFASNTKQMKQTLRALSGINVQYLTGFITKAKHPGGVPRRGVHPLLEKEALDIVMRSGAVPRKVEYRRG